MILPTDDFAFPGLSGRIIGGQNDLGAMTSVIHEEK
jgi:hypothetical protein